MLMVQEINRTNLTSPFKCDHKVQVNRNQIKAQESSDDNVKEHNLIILHCMMKRLMWTDSTLQNPMPNEELHMTVKTHYNTNALYRSKMFLEPLQCIWVAIIVHNNINSRTHQSACEFPTVSASALSSPTAFMIGCELL